MEIFRAYRGFEKGEVKDGGVRYDCLQGGWRKENEKQTCVTGLFAESG